jgi:hypothetical protein
MNSSNLSIFKTEKGFSIINKDTKTLKCGHNYPQFENLLIGCKKEIKDLFANGDLLTYEFINKLTNQKNKTRIILPIDKKHVEEMMNTTDPLLLSIKEKLEQNEEKEDLDFLKFFFNAWQLYLWEEGAVEVQKIVLHDFLHLVDHARYILFDIDDCFESKKYEEHEWLPLLSMCEKNEFINSDTLKRVKSFFTTEKSFIHFYFGIDYFLETIQLLIQDFDTGEKNIWVSIGFSDSTGGHANQILIDNTEREVLITFFDPQLVKKNTPNSKHLNSRGKEIYSIQQRVTEHFESFVRYISNKKVISQRKVIRESCEIDRALQSKKDIRPGLCSPYSTLMASIYLLNKTNNTLNNDYHSTDDDVTCFFALLGNGALNLLAIFFYSIFVKYPEIRRDVFSKINESEYKSLNSLVTLYFKLNNEEEQDKKGERNGKEEE